MTTLPLSPHKREVLRAWLDGKPPQYRFSPNNPWQDFDPNNHVISLNDDNYRIKPTPSRRFWKPEEVPVGWQARDVSGKSRGIILFPGKDGSACTMGLRDVTSDNFMHYEVAPPGPANAVQWQPAGVEE